MMLSRVILYRNGLLTTLGKRVHLYLDLAMGRVNPLGYPTRWVLGRVLGRVSGSRYPTQKYLDYPLGFGLKIGYPKIYLGHPLGS